MFENLKLNDKFNVGDMVKQRDKFYNKVIYKIDKIHTAFGNVFFYDLIPYSLTFGDRTTQNSFGFEIKNVLKIEKISKDIPGSKLETLSKKDVEIVEMILNTKKYNL